MQFASSERNSPVVGKKKKNIFEAWLIRIP